MRDPRLDEIGMEFNASVDLLGIAERVLTGRIAAAAGRWDDAVTALQEAVAREDALLYGEPPEWSVPTRQELGAVQLAAGRASDAERTFRDDLARFPENGWSLRGLALSLRAQGENSEADRIDAEFGRVWATADVDPPALGTM
jgi:tetratricopeptide (TPR) repeat protein